LDFTPVQIASASTSKADIKAEREERQLLEKGALLKKEKAAKDAAATKQVSNSGALPVTCCH
jgi:hypothetical protein